MPDDWGSCEAGRLVCCRDVARVMRSGVEGWHLEKVPLVAGEKCRLVLVAPDGTRGQEWTCTEPEIGGNEHRALEQLHLTSPA